jgi:hypothetical protein
VTGATRSPSRRRSWRSVRIPSETAGRRPDPGHTCRTGRMCHACRMAPPRSRHQPRFEIHAPAAAARVETSREPASRRCSPATAHRHRTDRASSTRRAWHRSTVVRSRCRRRASRFRPPSACTHDTCRMAHRREPRRTATGSQTRWRCVACHEYRSYRSQGCDRDWMPCQVARSLPRLPAAWNRARHLPATSRRLRQRS